MFINYLIVFLVGGFICVLGQLLINLTKITSSRILVIFLLLGIVLETVGVFQYLKDFAGAGVSVPIVGFGSNLAKGAIKGALEDGIIGALVGGVKAASAGLGAAIFVGFVVAIFSKSRTK